MLLLYDFLEIFTLKRYKSENITFQTEEVKKNLDLVTSRNAFVPFCLWLEAFFQGFFEFVENTLWNTVSFSEYLVTDILLKVAWEKLQIGRNYFKPKNKTYSVPVETCIGLASYAFDTES